MCSWLRPPLISPSEMSPFGLCPSWQWTLSASYGMFAKNTIVDVLLASAVVGEVFEVLGDAGNETVRVGAQPVRAPHEHVVGVRRHHRAAVVVHVVEREVEPGRRGCVRAQRLIRHRMPVRQHL